MAGKEKPELRGSSRIPGITSRFISDLRGVVMGVGKPDPRNPSTIRHVCNGVSVLGNTVNTSLIVVKTGGDQSKGMSVIYTDDGNTVIWDNVLSEEEVRQAILSAEVKVA
ncbi:MAG: hypothetical protein HYT83_02030 [Candidatus Levybacteria bacterium]|nr:hypothetical protein [Candidatus Levybacteria bacterium]